MIFEYTIEGRTVGFRFNFRTFGVLEKSTGIGLDTIISTLSSKTAKADLICEYFFAGAKHYAQSKGLPVDFSSDDVADWLSVIGLEKSFYMIAESLGTETPKNSLPHHQKVGTSNGELTSTLDSQ